MPATADQLRQAVALVAHDLSATVTAPGGMVR
jgi:hypothetical protein